MSSRRTSIGTVFWGVTLVAVGALLLARNFGYSIPVWGAVARYWPVLIIAWGMLKLVDYYRMKRDGDQRPIFSGGEVAMLIFVIFAGSAITAAANINPEIGNIFNFDGDFDLWDITGSNYDYTEHHELDATPGATIEIFNRYGAVEVKPSDGDRIILDVAKTVRAESKEDADRREKDFTFSIVSEGSRYRIASNRDQNAGRPGVEIRIGNERQRYKSSLTIRVPKKSLLDLNNGYGTVTVEDLEGNQQVRNKYGASNVARITGSVKLTGGYGSVVVEGITGDAEVLNSYASTTVRDVTGQTMITSKYGSVDAEDLKANVNIENRYSVINVQRVHGDVTIKGGNNSVDVDNVDGTLNAVTTYKNLSVRNVKGEMNLSNRHGGVDVELEQAPKERISVTGEYSDVSLELPADAAFSIEGQTRYGNIDSEFESVSINSSGRERSIRGQQGTGGPRITVETRNGSIRLDKRG